MNCPHCNQPLDPAAIRKLLNKELASRKRPGSKGNVRNPQGRKGKPKDTPQTANAPTFK